MAGMPIIALIDSVCPVTSRPLKAPTGTNSIDDKIISGVLSPPKVMLMIRNRPNRQPDALESIDMIELLSSIQIPLVPCTRPALECGLGSVVS